MYEKGSPPPYSASAPPPPGFIQPPQYSQPPTQHVITMQQQPPPTVIVVGGGCPKCHVGVVQKSHITFCGILWSILLFPFGLLCLLCCTTDRCSNCSYTN